MRTVRERKKEKDSREYSSCVFQLSSNIPPHGASLFFLLVNCRTRNMPRPSPPSLWVRAAYPMADLGREKRDTPGRGPSCILVGLDVSWRVGLNPPLVSCRTRDGSDPPIPVN